MRMGNLSDFLGGALSEAGNQQTRQDKIDDEYKSAWAKVAPQKAIDEARISADTASKVTQINAKKNEDAPGNDLKKLFESMHTNPAGGADWARVPDNSMPMPSNPDEAIQPRTSPVQMANNSAPQAPAPITGQPVTQAQPQPSAPVGQPGGEVPLQGANEASTLPPGSPAAQAVQATQAQIGQQQQATEALSPVDQYIKTLPASTQMEANSLARLGSVTDPKDLEALLYQRAQYAGDPQKFQTEVLQPWLSNRAKDAKNAPIDTSQWGMEDQAALAAMKREGLVGDASQFKPLTPAQKKDNDTLVQQAYQIKTAATQGIGTFSRIIQKTSKINPGPGAETAAFIKSAWAQMTDSQRSEALTTFYEGQKETVNALNAQINTMRQQGGRFVVGANVLKLEERGIPDITKMPPEASLALAQGYINNYKQMIGQADAILGTPEEVSPIKRLQFANRYAEKNPTFLGDGDQTNPNWQEFQAWRDNANKDGATQTSNRTQASVDAGGALADAKAGGKGEVPNKEESPKVPSVSNAEDYNKVKPGSQYTDPQGNIRTKK